MESDGDYFDGEILEPDSYQHSRITMDHQQSEGSMGCDDDDSNLLGTLHISRELDIAHAALNTNRMMLM